MIAGMGFERVQETTRPRHVVDQVLKSIREGSFAPGARLPAEAKLAELTGVGRTSVREALAALRLMGVVETRVGDGTYVRSGTDLDAAVDRVAGTIAQSEEAFQLQEARAAIESGIVRLAAARWTQEKGERFDELLGRMDAAAADECYEDYIRLHRDFHLMVAEVTDNAVIVRTEAQFLESMDHEGWQDMERQLLLPNRAEAMSASVAEHRAIAVALASGDGTQAAELMHAHFERYEHDE